MSNKNKEDFNAISIKKQFKRWFIFTQVSQQNNKTHPESDYHYADRLLYDLYEHGKISKALELLRTL